MDYTKLLHELNDASLFDLYRLSIAIRTEVENPVRIAQIKTTLRIGMTVTYFDSTKNKPIKASVIELKKKNLLILEHEQNKKLIIPYYMLNIDMVDTEIHKHNSTESLTANHLKVGEIVGFNKNGLDIIGIIKRLNNKTVTVVANDGELWKVSYSYLYKIYNSEATSYGKSKVLGVE